MDLHELNFRKMVLDAKNMKELECGIFQFWQHEIKDGEEINITKILGPNRPKYIAEIQRIFYELYQARLIEDMMINKTQTVFTKATFPYDKKTS